MGDPSRISWDLVYRFVRFIVSRLRPNCICDYGTQQNKTSSPYFGPTKFTVLRPRPTKRTEKEKEKEKETKIVRKNSYIQINKTPIQSDPPNAPVNPTLTAPFPKSAEEATRPFCRPSSRAAYRARFFLPSNENQQVMDPRSRDRR